MVEKELYAQQQLVDDQDEAEFEQVLEKAHRLEQNTQRVVATGEVWRALNSDDSIRTIIKILMPCSKRLKSLKNIHRMNIFRHLLMSSPLASTSQTAKQNLDWDDDEIFDELLAAVPGGKTATDVHTPFNHVDPGAIFSNSP